MVRPETFGPYYVICNSRCLVQCRITVPQTPSLKFHPSAATVVSEPNHCDIHSVTYSLLFVLLKIQFKEIGTLCLISRLCCVSDKIVADLQETRDITP